MKFFFDTANATTIQEIWNDLKQHVDPKSVVGITTNPNAMHKEACLTLTSWKDRLRMLSEVLKDIRGDSEGLIYVQQPNSNMLPGAVETFINDINVDFHSAHVRQPNCRIGLKIPPYPNVLKHAGAFPFANVTGIADCSTALRALSYDVRYVSVIPGRMEEKGINAKEQVAFIMQRKPDNKDVITGSMRTVEGLAWVVQYGTVPTIGTGVWAEILNELGADGFVNLWKNPIHIDDMPLSPLVTSDMHQLSVDFFNQMDELGDSVYKEL